MDQDFDDSDNDYDQDYDQNNDEDFDSDDDASYVNEIDNVDIDSLANGNKSPEEIMAFLKKQ